MITISEWRLQRLFAKIDKGTADECWLWQRGKIRKGYGQVRIKDKRYVVSRLIYQLEHPTIDITGLVVMHTCDNPPCCNPAHLVLGTYADNLMDSINKGRRKHCKGRPRKIPK